MMTEALSVDAQRLLAAFGSEQLRRNGVPDERTARRRADCHRLIADAMGGPPGSVWHSPLGVAWTEVFDAHPGRPVAAHPEHRGWLRLDGLDAAGERGAAVWAVLSAGEVVGAVRIHDTPPALDPVRAVLAGCRRRGEVRLREVLELQELRELGRAFPSHDRVLQVAAEIESGLGGRRLAPWASGRTSVAPASIPRARASRRVVVVAISGVDGSGKSTLREGLAASLENCGLRVSTVWVRPGMGLGWLTRPAARVKRLLRQDAAPGLRAVAAGEGARLRSRAGAVGWAWAMLVTGSFLVGVWRQHRRADGVVIYDRHMMDALATLDFAYAGVDLRLPHRLVRALLPKAAVSVYLDIPAEVSVARKPDDLIGADAIRRQLLAYERWLAALPSGPLRLDAGRPPHELQTEVLRLLCAAR